MRRLGITVIGQGVAAYDEPLFRKLRAHGAYFTAVKRKMVCSVLLEAVAARAKEHPARLRTLVHRRWGGSCRCSDGITCVSYKGLEPARAALLAQDSNPTRSAWHGS